MKHVPVTMLPQKVMITKKYEFGLLVEVVCVLLADFRFVHGILDPNPS
jgi:hypothetical protein